MDRAIEKNERFVIERPLLVEFLIKSAKTSKAQIEAALCGRRNFGSN